MYKNDKCPKREILTCTKMMMHTCEQHNMYINGNTPKLRNKDMDINESDPNVESCR